MRTVFRLLCVCLLLSLELRSQQAPAIVFSIDTKDKAQTIQNIGVSGCWFSEPIGKYWPAEKKEGIAELLFSRNFDKAGNPLGIGVSMFRFNIGGGTAEQGAAGGIADSNHRVESFLGADGRYDGNKQAGYQCFLHKAKNFGVENLLAFSNTPPVQFAVNGLGFKTTKDSLSNLRPDRYAEYAGFLATVMEHFDKEGLHFNYISPVNEPQWDWSGKVGSAKQEGTPWTNTEIYRVVQSLDSALQSKKIKTNITAAEAGMLTFLYGQNTAASRQVQNFFTASSPLSFTRFPSVAPVIAGHSYFTDSNDSNLINIRQHLADTVKKYGIQFWQSEYCMLGDGYKEGVKGPTAAIDCALFLAKMIHTDLTVANATAWHLWNAYEPGNAEHDTRYYVLALKPDAGFRNGNFTVTKNLWALGQYSLFIRPGMQRLNIQRSDRLNNIEAAQKTMVSAYINQDNQLVVVAINYTKTAQPIQLQLRNSQPVRTVRSYTTSAAENDNMRYAVLPNVDALVLPARSISTFVIN